MAPRLNWASASDQRRLSEPGDARRDGAVRYLLSEAGRPAPVRAGGLSGGGVAGFPICRVAHGNWQRCSTGHSFSDPSLCITLGPEAADLMYRIVGRCEIDCGASSPTIDVIF